MMDKGQLKSLIEETLKEIDLYSEDAVNLLLGTAAQESAFGRYIKQLGNGPALGIFQMEPATHYDIFSNYIFYKEDLKRKIVLTCQLAGPGSGIYDPDAGMLRWNLKYAICMARIHYLRVPEPIPSTIEGYANYWKDHYNTYLGAGTVEEIIHNYKKYVL